MMTRIVNGIFSSVELGDGFFITDKQADLIAEWLTSYANALEKTWVKKGSNGDPKTQKFAYVRSFAAGVARARADWPSKGSETTIQQTPNEDKTNG